MPCGSLLSENIREKTKTRKLFTNTESTAIRSTLKGTFDEYSETDEISSEDLEPNIKIPINQNPKLFSGLKPNLKLTLKNTGPMSSSKVRAESLESKDCVDNCRKSSGKSLYVLKSKPIKPKVGPRCHCVQVILPDQPLSDSPCQPPSPVLSKPRRKLTSANPNPVETSEKPKLFFLKGVGKDIRTGEFLDYKEQVTGHRTEASASEESSPSLKRVRLLDFGSFSPVLPSSET